MPNANMKDAFAGEVRTFEELAASAYARMREIGPAESSLTNKAKSDLMSTSASPMNIFDGVSESSARTYDAELEGPSKVSASVSMRPRWELLRQAYTRVLAIYPMGAT